ncbi:MAG: hypothetical protein LBQ60_04070 [Bacteroidales bacterium]|jgi:hypothetical protein|nr:hypothetical protein [Bacteroidales bacterium]
MENEEFIKKIISDFDRYSFFVSIEVESPEYRGRVIIENDDLYHYYNQTQNIDKKKYQEIMHRMLQKELTLKIKNEDFNRFNFFKVLNDATIIANTQKGVDNFIKVYFNGRVLKDDITDNERYAIINQLYHFNVLSKIDDETGYLVLYK